MSDGIVIHLDDDTSILEIGKRLFEQMHFPLQLKICKNIKEFKKEIDENKENLKCLIFDLVWERSSKGALGNSTNEFLKYINKNFALFNIPIFIYSGYLQNLGKRFDNMGTVFKVDKNNGMDVIFNKIGLFQESGFLDVFCPGGLLKTAIYKDIHNSFVGQFRNDEIGNIIESIKKSNPENFKDRCIEVFKRISVKSLMSELLAPIAIDDTTVNPIEHYYRRISKTNIWTGDIFVKKNNSESVVILTPRCDIANNKTKNCIVCEIKMGNPEISSKRDRIKSIEDILTDNILGKTIRWLPKSPVFFGGKVMLSSYKMISKSVLKKNYNYCITLSDDLTNELLGKFSGCFLRTGINTISPEESSAYFEILKEASIAKK